MRIFGGFLWNSSLVMYASSELSKPPPDTALLRMSAPLNSSRKPAKL
ncbi:Uncharacterised protein [Klebsiella pneumoniae]|nr:Uncharacterised protein [Klebsiella pneumoniae]